MIRAVIEWSQKFRLLVAVVAAVLLFFGISRLREMPIARREGEKPPHQLGCRSRNITHGDDSHPEPSRQ